MQPISQCARPSSTKRRPTFLHERMKTSTAMLLHWQSFLLGIAISIGCLSYLSTQFNGLGHIPTAIELPGIGLANLLDKVPLSIASSSLWPNALFERIEGLLDYYTCPLSHEYRVDMVSQEPLILRFRGFLPPGEATHLLKLSYAK